MNELDEHMFKIGFKAAVSAVCKFSPTSKAARELQKPAALELAIKVHNKKLGFSKDGLIKG